MAVRLKKQKEEKQTFCGVCVALWNIYLFYHHFLSHKSHYTYYAVTFIIFKGYYYTSQTDLNWVCTNRNILNF